jgi:glutathione S-transferase
MALVSWGLWLNWDLGGLLLNLATELIGAVVTYLLLERLVGEREQEEKERQRLIAEIGSSVKDVAVAAAERLRKHGWLTDGTLSGADLRGADLSWADLREANLREAYLICADLREADLREAYLTGAKVTDEQLAEAWS